MDNTLKFHSREIQIMRQSQSKMALDYATSMGIKITVEELQRITDLFLEFCIRPIDDDLKKRMKALDEWIAKKCKEQNGKGIDT